MEESHLPQKEQKEPCITLPNALGMPAKNKQESFISDQNYDLLGATDCLGELKLNPEKHQPALEEQGMLFVCCEDTGMGCRENRKLRPTEGPRRSQECREAALGTKGQPGTHWGGSAGTGTVQAHAQQ